MYCLECANGRKVWPSMSLYLEYLPKYMLSLLPIYLWWPSSLAAVSWVLLSIQQLGTMANKDIWQHIFVWHQLRPMLAAVVLYIDTCGVFRFHSITMKMFWPYPVPTQKLDFSRTLIIFQQLYLTTAVRIIVVTILLFIIQIRYSLSVVARTHIWRSSNKWQLQLSSEETEECEHINQRSKTGPDKGTRNKTQ